MFIFCDIVEQQYVETSEYDSHSTLFDVVASLSKLKLDVTGRGKGVCLTPDDLFRGYMDYIPFLPAVADQWGFHLPLLIFQTLLLDL